MPKGKRRKPGPKPGPKPGRKKRRTRLTVQELTAPPSPVTPASRESMIQRLRGLKAEFEEKAETIGRMLKDLAKL